MEPEYSDSKRLIRDTALGVLGALVLGLSAWGLVAILGLPGGIAVVGGALATTGIITVVNVYHARKRDDRWREEVRLRLGSD